MIKTNTRRPWRIAHISGKAYRRMQKLARRLGADCSAVASFERKHKISLLVN